MNRSRRRKLLLTGLITCFVLGLAAFLFVYEDPFWLVERGTDVYLWKHGVHHREVVVDNHRIHYLEAAPSHPGPEKPILLIHGLGARASDWAALTPSLANHGYHVYALDLLGYGDSDKPADGDFSLEGEERIVEHFADALHLQKPDVAGWSMGGWIAAKYALDHPTKLRRLLLYDSAGLYMPLDFPVSLFTPTSEAALNQLLYHIEPDKPHIRLPSFAVPGLLRRFQRNARMVNGSLSSMLDGREILDFRLQKLKMPVLIVWGSEDKLTPVSSAERMHELLPQSVLVKIDGCGHLAIAECAPQAVPVTVRFLDADPPMQAIDRTLPSRNR